MKSGADHGSGHLSEWPTPRRNARPAELPMPRRWSGPLGAVSDALARFSLCVGEEAAGSQWQAVRRRWRRKAW